MKFDVDFNHPKVRAAATAFVQIGADKQKKLISEETKDRKAVNAAVDAFWKKAPLEMRRAFLAQLAGFTTERNATRLVRFGQNLTELAVAPTAAPPAPAEPKGQKDADKAE